MDRKEKMVAKMVGAMVLIAVMWTGGQPAWAGTKVLGNALNYGLPKGDGTAGDISDLVAVSSDSPLPSMTLYDGSTGDPADLVAVSSDAAVPTMQQNPLSGVPNYQWWYGCSPTSGGMMVGYWDGQSGFGNLYDGDASVWGGDGNSGTRSMVASTAHITAGAENGYTYGDWHNSASYPNHEANPDCIADFMKTVDGGSSSTNIQAGLEAYVEWDNPNTGINESYPATTTRSQVPYYGGSYEYNDLKAEIDNDRPVMLNVVTISYEGTDDAWFLGHSIVAYGYQDDMFDVRVPVEGGPTVNLTVGGVAVMDTWPAGIAQSEWINWTEDGLVFPIIDGNGVEWWPFIQFQGSSWTFGSGSYGPYDWMVVEGITLDIVPEPATLALLALGGLAMLLRRRRAC